MKTFFLLSLVASVAAFAPAQQGAKTSVALNAESMDRKAFIGVAAAAVLGAAAVPAAYAMDQEYVSDATEVWETGKPDPKIEAARMARYQNARNQMNSNFPPIKRLTLERKSPVTRLDINAPDFTAYKKSNPGLFKN